MSIKEMYIVAVLTDFSNNWCEPERAPHYRGLREHVHRPTDRPGDQPTDRPTDRPCPSQSRDIDRLHVPMLPRSCAW